MISDEQRSVATKLASVLKAFAGRLRLGEHEQVLLDAAALEMEEIARLLQRAAIRLRTGEHDQSLLDAVAMELEEKAFELEKEPDDAA